MTAHRTIDRTYSFHKVATGLAVSAVLLSGSAAFAQASMPDAQVESNVLKSLATAPDLAGESITTSTVYGTVTLSGSVRTEAARRHAEALASTTEGVKKVVDELTLGTGTALQPAYSPRSENQSSAAAPLVLQSDGTYAPADTSAQPTPGSAPASMAQRNDPDNDQSLDQQQGTEATAAVQPGLPSDPQTGNQQTPGASPYPSPRRPLTTQTYPYGNQPYPQQQGYPQQQYPQQQYPPQQYPPQQYPPQQGGYPQQQYPNQAGYPQQNQPNGYGRGIGAAPLYGGQIAGESVVVPAGALLRIRLNRTLSSDRTPAGTTFDGIVTDDVTAGGAIAIPRGAAVQGVVLDAKSSGHLHGRGELSIQLTGVQLAGRTYPLVSDVWAHHGGDKTIETINKTAGFGAGGALLGALAGGGVGAAVGGGIGAALGLGSSAASGNGQVYLPAEGLLTFHLDQPASLQTVSEQEMQRLAYGVPAGAEQQRRYRRAPGLVVAPGYGPYGYPAVPYGYPTY